MKQILGLLLLCGCIWAVDVKCSFAKGKWNASQWKMMHTFRWATLSTWVQDENGIHNFCPTDCSPADLLDKRAPETYVSMVWGEPVKRDSAKISTTVSFDDRMSAELVLVADMVKNAKGEMVAHEYWEIVLYDQGINVWKLKNVDGKAVISRLCYVSRKFKPKTPYKMTVSIIRNWTGRPQLQVTCDGTTFGCQLLEMPDKVYAGITGCEGVVRFYDFTLKD